jgi:Family of unknown function (DUF6551)
MTMKLPNKPGAKLPPHERITFACKIHLVPMQLMRRPEFLQKEFNQARADRMAADFKLEGLGRLVVNHRDGVFYIIDGCHRHDALLKNGFGEYDIECDVYENLSDEEMARVFLLHANRRVMSAFEKFSVKVEAKAPRELDILRTVEGNHLKITRSREAGCINAVSALGKVYDMAGSKILGMTLRTLRDAYDGDPAAFDGPLIAGLGGVFNRFNGRTHEKNLVDQLASLSHGVRGIHQKAEKIRQATQNDKTQCISAVLVDIHNKGLSPKLRLPSWWKDPNTDGRTE